MDFYFSTQMTEEKLDKLCHGYTLDQLERLYIAENQSAELVSRNTGIDLPVLIKVLNDSGLSGKKTRVMGNKTYEKKRNDNKEIGVSTIKDDDDSVWSEL